VTVTATSEGIRGTATRVVVIRYRSVSAGAMHACDIASGGIAWRWGLNGQQGRIGLPTMTEHAASSTPVAIAGNLLLTSITAGSEYACAATTSGAGQCWGYSGLGNLGDGGKISFGNTYVTMPQAVVGGLSFRAVSAGFNHTCGVTTTDAVWCWGSNTSGQLGLTLGNGSNVPVRAGGSLLAAEVSAANLATGSASFTCAIADDRLTTFCRGRNDVGQLGNGATSTAAAINAAPSIVQGQKPLPRTR
jgi:alpha-tubulin suppressor-like RCC1 family protein